MISSLQSVLPFRIVQHDFLPVAIGAINQISPRDRHSWTLVELFHETPNDVKTAIIHTFYSHDYPLHLV